MRNYIILSFFLSPSFLFGKFFFGCPQTWPPCRPDIHNRHFRDQASTYIDRGPGVARPLVWVWLCEEDNSAFPQRFHLLTTKLTKHAFFFHQERSAATHLRALPLVKIVGVKSMLSLFGQLRWGYGFQARSTHQLRHNPLVEMTGRPVFPL